MLAPLCLGPVTPAPFKSKSHAFKSCSCLEQLKVISLANTHVRCMISACSIYGFIGKVPIWYPKVFALPVLLGNVTIFFGECPFNTGLIGGRVYDVFHASLISDFLVWGFLSPGLRSFWLDICTTFTCQATVSQNETAHSDVIEPFGLHVCWSHSRVAHASVNIYCAG